MRDRKRGGRASNSPWREEKPIPPSSFAKRQESERRQPPKPRETGFAAPAIERRKKAQVDSFLPLPLQPPQSGPNPLPPHLPRSAFKRPSSSGQLQEEEGRRIGGRSWDGGRGRTMIAPSSLTPSRRRKGKGGPPLPLSGEKEARYGIRLISIAQLQKLFFVSSCIFLLSANLCNLHCRISFQEGDSPRRHFLLPLSAPLLIRNECQRHLLEGRGRPEDRPPPPSQGKNGGRGGRRG